MCGIIPAAGAGSRVEPLALSKQLLRDLPWDTLSFLLFPVAHPEIFDAMETTQSDACGRLQPSSRRAHPTEFR